MSTRYEFFAQVRDGMIELPGEIASRLRHKGLDRLRVSVVAANDDLDQLRDRGIDGDTVQRIAERQVYAQDVALAVLRAEGSVSERRDLVGRLREPSWMVARDATRANKDSPHSERSE